MAGIVAEGRKLNRATGLSHRPAVSSHPTVKQSLLLTVNSCCLHLCYIIKLLLAIYIAVQTHSNQYNYSLHVAHFHYSLELPEPLWESGMLVIGSGSGGCRLYPVWYTV